MVERRVDVRRLNSSDPRTETAVHEGFVVVQGNRAIAGLVYFERLTCAKEENPSQIDKRKQGADCCDDRDVGPPIGGRGRRRHLWIQLGF